MSSTDKEYMKEQFEEKGKTVGEVARELGAPRFRVAKWKRNYGLERNECGDHLSCDNCYDCIDCDECGCSECDECGGRFADVRSHKQNIHEEE